MNVADILDYDQIFTEDERTIFKNKMPRLDEIRELKRIIRMIQLAVEEDTVDGYNRAAKLHKQKLLLIGSTTT